MRRVTYSRNYTLSLSRTCQCFCKYCSFATHQPHLYAPDEVGRRLDDAVRRRCKELLILTGERPEVNSEVAERLALWGHDDFTSYVVWACEQALERGLLPHTNIGVVDRTDLARLREVTASQGLMLESVSERLMETVHAGSPTKHPLPRIEMIEAAGELRIPFTTGILVGVGETPAERSRSLRKIAELHEEFGHIQEVILQNFVPHPRYYGMDVAEIADESARERWSGVLKEEPATEGTQLPAWASEVTIEEMVELIRECRDLMPDVGIQIPPNLADWWTDLVEAGATDLGGLSANGDHISPEEAFPSPREIRERLAPRGFAVAERLCAYPRYLDPQWLEQGVLDLVKSRYWSFIPRHGSGRSIQGGLPTDPELTERAIEKGRGGEKLSEEELTALFSETEPELIERMRDAADSLREELAGDLATFVVNRNINFTNVCIVGCAFCGFGQGSRSPDAYTLDEAEFVARIEEAVEFGATEICMQGGIHPEYRLRDYGRWLTVAKETSPEIHLHAFSPMEIDHMCEREGSDPSEVFEYLIDCGLGSTPGTAAEVLVDGVRERISPNKLPVERWIEIIEAAHAAGLRSTSTVMFGHVEEPRELARHVAVVREVQERTGGITEFVPLSFIPHNTLLGRTHGVEEISTAENLKHTAAFRLGLGRSIRNLQASWVKMGIEGATESLRWGVNDLGGTLMEENISRMAGSQHGTRLERDDLVAAARKAGRVPAQRTTLYEVIETY